MELDKHHRSAQRQKVDMNNKTLIPIQCDPKLLFHSGCHAVKIFMICPEQVHATTTLLHYTLIRLGLY